MGKVGESGVIERRTEMAGFGLLLSVVCRIMPPLKSQVLQTLVQYT